MFGKTTEQCPSKDGFFDQGNKKPANKDGDQALKNENQIGVEIRIGLVYTQRQQDQLNDYKD